MSLLGYTNNGLAQSMNGIVSLSDGSGTVIENGSVTTGDLTANGSIFNDEILANAQKITDITYNESTLTTYIGSSLDIGNLLNGYPAAYYDPTSSIQTQINDITFPVTGISYDSGTDTTDIDNNLTVQGVSAFNDAVTVNNDFSVVGGNTTLNNIDCDSINVLNDIVQTNGGIYAGADGIQSTGDIVFDAGLISGMANDNCIVGNLPPSINTSAAQYNTGLGVGALDDLIGGDGNIAIGWEALGNITNGAANTAVGFIAGRDNGLITGNNNTLIGANAQLAGNYSNSTAIGVNAVASASNQIKLGTAFETVVCPNKITVASTSELHSVNMNGTNALSNANLQFVDYLGNSQALMYPSTVTNQMTLDSSMSSGVRFAQSGTSTLSVDATGNGTFSGNVNAVAGTFSGQITSATGLTINNNTSSTSVAGKTVIVGDATFPSGVLADRGLLVYRNASGADGEVDFVAGCGLGTAVVSAFAWYYGNFSTAPVLCATLSGAGNMVLQGSITSPTAVLATVTPNYDSGWFAVATSTNYTVTHNRGMTLTKPVTVKIFFSNNSSPTLGTHDIADVSGQTNALLVSHTDSNNLRIHTQSSICTYYNGPSVVMPTSGYLRVYVY